MKPLQNLYTPSGRFTQLLLTVAIRRAGNLASFPSLQIVQFFLVMHTALCVESYIFVREFTFIVLRAIRRKISLLAWRLLLLRLILGLQFGYTLVLGGYLLREQLYLLLHLVQLVGLHYSQS